MDGFTPSHRGGSGPPLVCIHGITDTWRSWELVLPALERRHDVLAVTLAGHAGGPPLAEPVSEYALAEEVERAMDEAGFEFADIVGNSLGGYVALQLAQRGRARTVVALAPAGGWAVDDESFRETLEFFEQTHELLQGAAPYADKIASTPEGRRRSTLMIGVNYEHIPADLVAHQIRGAAACGGLGPLTRRALEHGWVLRPERISCPVRVVWGTEDKVLRWPGAAARYRHEWLPHADWVELEGVGHCPQLDVPVETAELIIGVTAD